MNRPRTDSGAKDGAATRLWLGRGALAAVASVMVLAAGACGNDERDAPTGITPGTTTTTDPPACVEGAEQECIIFIAEHNGVATCIHGEQSCIGGQWEDCRAPSTTERSGPAGDAEPPGDSGMPPTRALSTPTGCVDNPCDPSCQFFDEEPPGGVPTEDELVGTFTGGTLSSIPGGFVGKGHNEPCSSAQDCQFDHYCSNPSFDLCEHDKCTVGVALAPGCDQEAYQPTQPECVEAICDIQPTCCGLPPGPPGTCAHHPCDVGDPLDYGCDACISSTCDAMPECCQTGYLPAGCNHTPCEEGVALQVGCDSASADCVTDICSTYPNCCTPIFTGGLAHNPCTLGVQLATGIDSCVDAVCTDMPGCCAGSNAFDPSCEASSANHEPCETGKGMPDGCDPCVSAVCDAMPSCCDYPTSHAWSQACVDLIETECVAEGKSCKTTWDQGCVDAIATTAGCGGMSCTPSWDAACAAATTTDCGQDCTVGAWDAACVAQSEASCAIDCDAADGWTQTCVNLVGTVCGAICAGPNEGDCVPFDPGERWANSICPGVDLTVGIPCTGFIPVCNRGNTDAAAGALLLAYPANSSHFPLCDPPTTDPPVAATCTVPAVPAGHCVNITEADCVIGSGGGAVLSGNRTFMVNPPGATRLPECFCWNNWGDYHSGGCVTTEIWELVDTTYSQIYEAVCPAGTGVQWGFFVYDTTTPLDSSVDFAVRTADDATALPAAPLTDLATAKATPLPDTQVCLMAGPAPCPIDLYQSFIDDLGDIDGYIAATNPVLELVVTLHPETYLTEGATVNDWEVTYSCIADE